MDTALPQNFSFIIDRNLAKANCTGNHVCTSCDRVVLGINQIFSPNCKAFNLLNAYLTVLFTLLCLKTFTQKPK